MYRILCVDDERDHLDLSKRFLEMSGRFQVDIASTADEAFEMLALCRYDALICDYQMEGMNGQQMLHSLREMGNEIPFILLTGRGGDEILVQIYNDGADAYVQKGPNIRTVYVELEHRIISAVERRQVEHGLKSLFNAAPVGMGFVKDRHYLDVNDYFENLTGYSREEIVGKSTRLLYENDAEFVRVGRSKYADVLNHGMGCVITRWVRKDGKSIDLMLSSAAITPGTLDDGVSFVAVDISELKDTQDKLQVEEGRLSSLSQQLDILFSINLDLLSVMDLQGRLVRLNDQWGKVLGYDVADLISVNILDLVHPDDREKVRLAMARIKEGHIVEDFLVRIRAKSGDYRWMESRSRLVHDDLIYNSVRDITDRINTEEALRLANRRLSLMNSITRHDMGNQIQVLSGTLELMKEDASGKQATYVARMEDRTKTINKLLEFTREYKDLGARSPEWQEFPSLIKKVVAMLDMEKNVKLNCKGGQIFADPLLEKVFYNLLENSQRYAGNDCMVEISCRRSEGFVELSVRDNGPGIPQSIRQNLFQAGKGTHSGMGLFLSREILACTGLMIEEVIVDPGTCFVIRVPVDKFRLNLAE